MNNFATLEHFLDLGVVLFYTVRLSDDNEVGKTLTEADEFVEKFQKDDTVKDEFDIIYQIIYLMGKRGAETDFFRHEGRADALPSPKSKLVKLGFDDDDFQALRLYAMRISKSVVVLFNGDIKTTRRAQDCPRVSQHFRLANKISSAIDKAIATGDIVPAYKKLGHDEDYELIF